MSDCATTLGTNWLAKRLRPVADARRIPISGTVELTARCNLECCHCYIADRSASGSRLREELDADAWERVFDELAEAGCLWLGLTGGEPLVRADFARIYSAARRRGFLVTLLTNGTLVTDAIADLLAVEPPRSVEISVYGASAETYAKVTGHGEAFAACLAGIERLVSRKVRVALKSPLTRNNAADAPGMRRLAEELGAPYRVDGVISAHIDRTTAVTEERLAPKALIALELSSPAVVDAWAKRTTDMMEHRDRLRTLLDCAAATSAFHIDWRGRLCPCLMVREPAVDISRGGFLAAWNGPLAEIAATSASPDAPCASCRLAPVCDQCGGNGFLEHGDAQIPVEYICELARARRDALERMRPETRWTT